MFFKPQYGMCIYSLCHIRAQICIMGLEKKQIPGAAAM